MAFRTEGLRAELGPAGGRVPPTPAGVGLPQGLVGRGGGGFGFYTAPSDFREAQGEQEPRPGDLHCLGKVPLEGTCSHRCPASWRNC